ncbi:MAG TPA: hypothetical protein VFX33_01365 [Actinomycetales bacterium]|nr:hypothetical protein [Actinomycetales bacterium]
MTTDRRDTSDQAAVTAVLNAALDGEPQLDLDLGEVRRAGRRRRRWRAVIAGACSMAVVSTAAALAVTLPWSGTVREVAPAARPSVSVAPDDAWLEQEQKAREGAQKEAAARAEHAARQQAAANEWRAAALAAVVGALGHEATYAPVDQTPPIEEVRSADGKVTGQRATATVDILRVDDDRWRRVDVQIKVLTGSLATDVLNRECSAPRGERCYSEQLDDGTQLLVSERLGRPPAGVDGDVSERTVQLITDASVVEATASARWSVDQLRAVVTSPRLQSLPSS